MAPHVGEAGPIALSYMANVIWTDEALFNLAPIVDHIEQFAARAAERMSDRLVMATEGLRDFANSRRPAGPIYRELPSVRPYVIRYRLEGDTVNVIRIRHGAQCPEA